MKPTHCSWKQQRICLSLCLGHTWAKEMCMWTKMMEIRIRSLFLLYFYVVSRCGVSLMPSYTNGFCIYRQHDGEGLQQEVDGGWMLYKKKLTRKIWCQAVWSDDEGEMMMRLTRRQEQWVGNAKRKSECETDQHSCWDLQSRGPPPSWTLFFRLAIRNPSVLLSAPHPQLFISGFISLKFIFSQLCFPTRLRMVSRYRAIQLYV